jgi:uncharacterized protein (DUF169 family)
MAEDRWKMEGEWGVLTRKLEALLRLKSFPVAFKFLENPEDLWKDKWVRRIDKKMLLCQLVTTVRNFDWTIGVDKDGLFPRCADILGFIDMPKYTGEGSVGSLFCKTEEDARKYEDSIVRIPQGKHKALLLAPLVYNPFKPDLILIYANPAQMILLINAIQFEDYEHLQFSCAGESSCSDAIARCYLTGKPSLTIPCYGERRYGHTQDDELMIALTPETLRKAVGNLEELYKRGIRYPIASYGAQVEAAKELGEIYPIYRKLL